MAQDFKENSVNNIDRKKYSENYDKIFGKEESEIIECESCGGYGGMEAACEKSGWATCLDCLGFGRHTKESSE